MPPTRGADGGKRVLWRTNKPVTQKNALRGLRALSKQLHAATVHAALIQGVLETLKAAACPRVLDVPN